jgi:glycosyltransferase involved in cell wall biosynthesis
VGEECFTTALPQEESVKPLILSYGRISPEKGFDIFIGAAKMLLERLRATETAKSVSAAEVANATKIAEATNMLTPEFMVVGNTDFSIEARRLYAERLVQSAATSSNIQVTATTEGITGKEKIALIDRALFGVILSRYEPFGMVIPEMMARGKPVVSTRTSGAIDIMQTDKLGINDFGIIVEANTSSVAEALLWLLDHPCELRQMSKNAFERAKDFTWSNAAKQFDILYRSDRI